MGQSSSNLLEESLRESIETLIDSAPEVAPEEDGEQTVTKTEGEPSPDDKESTDKTPKKLSNKLLFNDDYTELKITNGKQYLKWKTVTLSQNGMPIFLDI